MPQIINTNIASLTAQRNLNKSQSANQQALQRLSSGLRINSAKDDAAGLAISTRFNSQIRGLNVAIRNAGDGISLAQTAEGALGTMNDNLQRIRELSVQSANATNSDVDRSAIQDEVDQLIAEISRTADETDFNGRKLLDGSFSATFQIGANAGQTIDVSIAELTAEKLGAGEEAGVSALGTDSAIANGDLVINGSGIRASSATDDTASTNGADRSAISKAAAINDSTNDTGVAAVVNANVAGGTAMTATNTSGSITLNGITIDIATGGVDTVQDRASVVTAINAVSGQTGVVAEDTGSDDSGVTLTAADGRNIEIRYDKFASNGDAYTNALTAESTGLATGGSGSSGATATSASIVGIATVNSFISLGGSFDIAIDGEESITVTLSGTAGTIDDLVDDVQTAIDNAITANGYSVAVTVAASNGIISITSDSAGTVSSLVVDTVVDSTAADLARILGYRTAAASPLTTADINALYFDSQGTDGGANSSGTFVGRVGLKLTTGVDKAQTVTAGDATFSIEVDGGVAVTVTVGAEVNDITTAAGSLATYAAKVQSAINAQLTGGVSVTVSTLDGYRLQISSDAEGTDSAIRISGSNTIAASIGLFTSTTGPNATNGEVGTVGVESSSETYEGSLTLRSVNGDDIAITSGSGSLSASGLQDGSFNAGQAFASSQSTSVSGAVASSGSAVGAKTSTGGLDDTLVSGMANVTIGFSIEVDGGDAVAISFAATTTDVSDLATYLNKIESEINSALSADSQSSSVTVSTNSDNQLVITSNAVGTSSDINISTIITTGDNIEEIQALGLRENLGDAGASGAIATQAVLTATGEFATLTAQFGNKFTAATTFLFSLSAETIRLSIDGGKTIDVAFTAQTLSDVTAALSYVESTINDALSAAGQSGTVDLALNTDGYVTITSDKVGAGSSIEILDATTVAGSFSQLAGLNDYMKATVGLSTVTTPDGLDSGDLILNGVSIEGALASDDGASNTLALSSSKQASGIAMAAAINKASEQTGVVATVNTTSLAGGTQVATATTDTPQQGSIYINGTATSTITTNGENGGADDRAAVISAINAITGQTGVTAIDDGKGITLEASDGRNISVVIDNNAKSAAESSGSFDALTGAAIGLNVAEADIAGGATFAATAQTQFSSVTLDGPGKIELEAGQNGVAALEGLGLRAGSYGSSEAGTRLADLDVTTVAGAEAAIKAIDNAIGAVASQRATLGAIQNRMDSTVNNLSVTSNNLSAANSRIQDADFAAETAELSRSQVLQQAGISILAQANAQPQQVLSLLG